MIMIRWPKSWTNKKEPYGTRCIFDLLNLYNKQPDHNEDQHLPPIHPIHYFVLPG